MIKNLTILMGSTGPMLFTYTAVSITVGLTETSQKTYCTEMISIHFCMFFCINSKELKQTPCHYISHYINTFVLCLYEYI